jgi:ABC-type transport system involved in cytochrome c biogenesis ATPase subunit
VKEHVKIWRKLRNAASNVTVVDDEDVIAECDLVEKSQATAATLSGGQLRKLQLATAFVGGSKICCVDEASSGLVRSPSCPFSLLGAGRVAANSLIPGPVITAEYLGYHSKWEDKSHPADNYALSGRGILAQV